MRWLSRSRPTTPFSLIVLALLTFLSSRVAAQQLPTLTGTTDNAIPTAGPEGPTNTDDAPTPTAGASQSDASDDNTDTQTGTDASETDSVPSLTFPGSAGETGTDSAPTLSTGISNGVPSLTGLPTLSGVFSYPPPSVPPTAKAPYMQQSNLPEGTVFIAVGAALGFFAFALIAWRVLVAWSINRSVRRSATQGYTAMGDPSYDPASKSDRRKSTLYSTVAPAGSTMSLEKLVSTRTGSNPAKPTSRDPSASGLFFSPTAGNIHGHAHPNRNSGAYLPSGYYASSTASPAPGVQPSTLLGTGLPGDRGSKLRPHSGVYASRNLDPSPPDSPEVRPSTAGLSTTGSRSSLNLSGGAGLGGSRAPSTYLDDLVSAPPLPVHGVPLGGQGQGQAQAQAQGQGQGYGGGGRRRESGGRGYRD